MLDNTANNFTLTKSLQINGKLVTFETPKIMRILNVTPDSFYTGSRHPTLKNALAECKQMVADGADFIDIGGASTRPGAKKVPEAEELKRVVPIINQIRKHFPDIPISIDTYNAKVAESAIKAGANIINDVSAGRLDERMFKIVASLSVPYVLMHMQGTPQTMQDKPLYNNVVAEAAAFLQQKTYKLTKLGVKDIIWDVGFGFGKSVLHNFTLLKNLSYFTAFDYALLSGISRKSMICKTLEVPPEDALYGSISAQMLAMQNGANIIRTHDVKATAHTRKIYLAMLHAQN